MANSDPRTNQRKLNLLINRFESQIRMIDSTVTVMSIDPNSHPIFCQRMTDFMHWFIDVMIGYLSVNKSDIIDEFKKWANKTDFMSMS